MRSFCALLGAMAAVAALVFSGCGGTAVDDVSMEEEAASYLEKSRNEKIKSIDCPSGEPVDPGHIVRCDVELSGGERKVLAIEIVNEDADIDIVGYRSAQ